MGRRRPALSRRLGRRADDQRRPRESTVVAAIVEQVKTLSHVSTLYDNVPQSDLAERMAQIAPGKLKKSFFTNSGTEANETAIAAAKHATGRHEIVALRHSYSGRAPGTLAASGQSSWKRLPAQVPGIRPRACALLLSLPVQARRIPNAGWPAPTTSRS